MVMARFHRAIAIATSLEIMGHGQVEIHCDTNLTILTQGSIKGHENLLMDDFTYIPTK